MEQLLGLDMADFVFPETVRRMSAQIELEEELVVAETRSVEEEVLNKEEEPIQSENSAYHGCLSQELSFAQVILFTNPKPAAL